jgi:hypothetical protein
MTEPDDTDLTRILQRRRPLLAWVHKNPQLAWAIGSAVATALVVGGSSIAIYKLTLSGLQQAEVADRKHLDEGLEALGRKVDALATNGPTVTNANIKALSDRLDKQEAWRDRVEAAAEIRVPRSRK